MARVEKQRQHLATQFAMIGVAAQDDGGVIEVAFEIFLLARCRTEPI